MGSIPLNLVTGFLGSGKTSFLLHYLDTFSKDRKIAVIQNEFSASGVDGLTIRRHKGAYRIMEVNNGSVFCVCLLGSFVHSLSAFIDDISPDEIIMEASGMSDPVSIGQIFQSPELRNKVYMGRTWSIVDARNFEKVKSLRIRIEHQIRIADTVVINKTDLGGDKVQEIHDKIRKINPFAKIVHSTFGRIDFGGDKSVPGFFTEPAKDTYKPDLQSVVIKSSKIITPEKLIEFVASVKGEFIRLKGYAATGKNKKTFVQLTFDDSTFEDVDWFPGITELVGIGNFSDSVNFTKKYENFCSDDQKI